LLPFSVNKDVYKLLRAGCGFEPLSSGSLVGDCSSLRVSCLDRLSLIVEGLNTTPKSTSAADTGGNDVTCHVAVDKMAPNCASRAAQAANC